MGTEHKNKAAKASTAAAVFDTKHSSPALEPAKKDFGQRNLLDAVYRMHKMYRPTKFVFKEMAAFFQKVLPLLHGDLTENLPDFHGAKTYRGTSIYYHAKHESQL